jgi:asparagine synthase (glutamine-hydrolysing)
MCGISGIIARDKSCNIPLEWIETMMAVQAHRGPDDWHSLQMEGACLGFNRLSIQDVSVNGRQPMTSPESGASIVFNGEIYNYVELGEALRSRGFNFKSRSDTEVLLSSFVFEGERCLASLNGMFAFAIYSPQREELFVARDRFGIKPFYYYLDETFFCFASEIKALLTLPFVPRRPNLPYLYASLFERSSDASDATTFEAIHQLRPAHRLVLKRSPWQLEFRRYWSLPEQEPQPVAMSSLDAVADEFRDLLASSVRLRLRSDRPVGLLLSGGTDSSSIAGMIAQAEAHTAEKSVPTHLSSFYTMALKGDSLDESPFAECVAHHLDRPLQKIEVGQIDLADLIPLTLWHNDEPIESLNRCVHWYMMKRLAAEDVIVVLNGQGGDETMGGYYDRLVGSTLMRTLGREGLHSFLAEWSATKHLCGFSSAWLLGQLAKNVLGHRLTRAYRSLTKERGLALASTHFLLRGAGRYRDEESISVKTDRINDQLLRWLLRDNVPALCHYEDRNSAAHGLEERFPFLDYRLVEFMFGLPGHFKAQAGVSKFLLRHAMRHVLPDRIIDRHHKLGLAVPEDQWIRGDLASLVQDTVSSQSFQERGIWRVSNIRRLIGHHMSGAVNCGNLIWRIVCAELWFQMFIDGNTRSARLDATYLTRPRPPHLNALS